MATITVSGRAEVSVAPDEATLALTVEAVRETASEALADVAERTRALIGLLDELEVGASSRATSGVSVAEEGDRDGEGRWQHRGYRASERLTVRVAEAATVGRLIGAAVERAGARVDGPWWRVAAVDPARLAVLRAAGEDARTKAEALAAGLGVRVGALVEAVEAGAERPEPKGGRRFAALAADVPIEAGEAVVVCSVSVTFQAGQG